MNLPAFIAALEPLVDSRVYSMMIPQAVLSDIERRPVIRVIKITGTPENTVDGLVTDADETRFQVDVYASSYQTALSIKDGVRAVVDAFTDPPALVETEVSFYEETDKLFRETIDVTFHDSSV